MIADALGAQAAHNPAYRVRVMLPRPALARNGIEIRPLPLLSEEEDRIFRGAGLPGRLRVASRARRRLLDEIRRREGGPDITLIQRQADMFPSLRVERAAIDERRFVLDVDDAIWRDARGAGGHPLAALKGSGRKLRWMVARADQVIAGNRLLAEWLGKHSDQVAVVPSLIDPAGVEPRAHADSERLTLGWIGSPPTAPYLRRLRDVIAALGRDLAPRGRSVRLLVVGAPGLRLDGVAQESWPWSERAEREALDQMDIGLMPLPDTPWTRGKCAYKALVYMNAGIPLVADDVGVTAEVVGPSGGLVVRGEDAWREALLELAGDVALRARLGAAGRERVSEAYSVERWAPELARLLRGG
ncbi:MAG: glycosyltransferase family 4 protein [Solirubrobacterales bacterium]